MTSVSLCASSTRLWQLNRTFIPKLFVKLFEKEISGLGILLNDVKTSRDGYGYGYGYYEEDKH